MLDTTKSNLILSQSSFSHEVNVPIEKVNIAKWLFSLPEAEYQRCCHPDHIAAGSTTTDDGRSMSINVEMIGTSLMIQHYVGEVTNNQYCKMVSTSDVFGPNGRTRVQVIWELAMKAIDAERCDYTNTVTSRPTEEFFDFIKAHGITFEQAARDRQGASEDHNKRETPLFAESIARSARTNNEPQR